MMLRLTVDIPHSLGDDHFIAAVTPDAYHRRGITIVTSKGEHLDVDLVNVDVVPEGRLIQ